MNKLNFLIQELRFRLRRRRRGMTTLSAKIVRADGTVEDLGVISQTKNRRWGTGRTS